MNSRFNLAYLALIAAIIVTPSLVTLSWYYVTGDPFLRPLGLTKTALRAYDGLMAAPLVTVVVDWDPFRYGDHTQARLENALRNAFLAKGVEAEVEFHAREGKTRVTFVVGKSTIGPYAVARAPGGINAAVEALRMLETSRPE